MITTETLNAGIDKLLNSFDQELFPLIDSIRIDNVLWGRLDIIINRYYNGIMEYLPLIMAFNKITDATEVKLGMVFDLPDMSFLLSQLVVYPDDENIPGVLKTTDNQLFNFQNIGQNSSETTALPKLNITLKRVTYDKTTGIITF